MGGIVHAKQVHPYSQQTRYVGQYSRSGRYTGLNAQLRVNDVIWVLHSNHPVVPRSPQKVCWHDGTSFVMHHLLRQGVTEISYIIL